MLAEASRFHRVIRVSKDGDARFLGHLDFGRLIERSLRRSGLPVQNTQGFNPRLKVSFTDALPVGVASEGEWITLTLTEDLSPDEIRARLQPAMPECVRLVDVRTGQVPAAETVRYRLTVQERQGSVADALTALLALESFTIEDPRRSEPLDVRARLVAGEVREGQLILDLVAVDGRAPRPGPIAQALVLLASQLGLETPVFGEATKLCGPERRQGDDTWDDAVEAEADPEGSRGTRSASSSSTLERVRRAG
jgi:radical SAM-linked protein